MPQIKFNWVDILFVTLLIRICYIGCKNGLLPEFLRLIGLLSAFIFSFNNYTLLSDFLSGHIKWISGGLDMVSFLFIFVAALFVFKILALFAVLFLGSDNISLSSRLMGFLLGCGRGILLIGLIWTLFVNSPFRFLSVNAKERSFSGQYVSDVAPFVYKAGIEFYPWEKIETPLVELLEEG